MIINRWKVVGLLIMVLLLSNIIWNQSIGVTRYQIKVNDSHSGLAGLRFVQLSDVHSIRKVQQAEKILRLVEKQQTQFIVITGDLVDYTYYENQREHSIRENRASENVDPLTSDFVSKLMEIAQVYYIYGNHDRALTYDGNNNGFVNELLSLGVQFLNNDSVQIMYQNEPIQLFGVNDVRALTDNNEYMKISDEKSRLELMLKDEISQLDQQLYSILLSHRPEYFDVYRKLPIDLVLTGHAHGGQIRLPFIGGLFAPGQGVFPKYTNGVFRDGRVNMVVNRGIGNSSFPLRVFNRPEIVTIELVSDNK